MSNSISTKLSAPFKDRMLRLSEMPAAIHEVSETVRYVGWCEHGASETDPKWVIMKEVADYPKGTYPRNATYKWAESRAPYMSKTLKWSDRLSYNYTF